MLNVITKSLAILGTQLFSTVQLHKTNMLNKFFSNCFNCLSAPLKVWCESDIYLPEDQPMNFLDVFKSSGPDSDLCRDAQTYCSKHRSFCHSTFNLSIKSSKKCKLSTVVPTPKSERSHSPYSYRPIFLLSVVSIKGVGETHPYSHLQPNSTILCVTVNGASSTVSVLLSTIHYWLQLMESGMHICIVIFDYRKAFDNIPHTPLMKETAGYWAVCQPPSMAI